MPFKDEVVVKRRRKDSMKDIDCSDTLRIKHERKPVRCEIWEFVLAFLCD